MESLNFICGNLSETGALLYCTVYILEWIVIVNITVSVGLDRPVLELGGPESSVSATDTVLVTHLREQLRLLITSSRTESTAKKCSADQCGNGSLF